MSEKVRTPGWRPVEKLEMQGAPDLAVPLAEALAVTGREDRLTHGFHTYPAALHPDAAKQLLQLVGGISVWDPFCGGGTVVVEAMTLGRRAVGSDVNPVAVLVAHARSQILPLELISRMRSWGRRIAESAKEYPDLPRDAAVREVAPYYEEHVARELEGIRVGIKAAPQEVQELLIFALSSILVKVSMRESDTRQAKIARHRPEETTSILFHKKVRELGRRLEELAAAVPPSTPAAEVKVADCRRTHPSRTVDAVVTSPPYPAVYDYVPLQTLRTAWLGLDDGEARRAEIGPRRAFSADRARAWKTWQEDTEAWLAQVAKALNPGGRAAIVIGDGVALDRPVDALGTIERLGSKVKLHPIARASGDRRDLGAKAVRREHILLLERR
ncbi:hypothetical protein L6R46_09275 [Myxococcota bacterium]|jgi:hypothetical protein|nr:hypothetical protein [Myxococcota bacterium]